MTKNDWVQVQEWVAALGTVVGGITAFFAALFFFGPLITAILAVLGCAGLWYYAKKKIEGYEQ